MKVVHVITGLGVGGAESSLCRLLEAISDEHSISSEVIVLGHEGELSGRIAGLSNRVTHLGMNPSGPSPRKIWRLRRELIEAAPGLVHCWMYHANLLVSLSSMRRKWPVIWGIRQCVYDLDDEKAMTRQIIRWGAKLSKMPQLITYNSETSNRQHTALGYSNCNSAVIPNGVDTDVFRTDEAVRRRVRDELKIPSGSFLIGIVGRYHPVKDHETFWRAARGMLEIRPNTYFAAVGTGLTSENSEVVERIRALGISENVRLVGNRSDMPAMYSALDVVTSTSVAEAFPNAILEGMACGRPCVATRVGDVDQIIGNKELTVMPRDPAGIVGSWMRLADCSIARRTQIGEECRRRVQECFSIQNLRQRYIEVYEQMRELG